MTVLHVLDHSVPVLSGYSVRSRSIVLFQRRLGLDPVVLTSPKHGPTTQPVEEPDGVRHYRTAASRGALFAAPWRAELAQMVRMARRIAEVARIEGATVLHAHSPLLNGLPALWAGRRLGLPVVYEARAFWEDAAVDHGTSGRRSLRYRVTRALETFLFRHVDMAVTICEGMRRDLVARGLAPARVAVVPNGVDTEWFRPEPRDAETRARLGLDGGLVFGFVGSFYAYEGLEFLLGAAADVVRRLPGARFLLVGGGPAESALRDRARGLGDAVVMPGRLPHAEIRRIYAAMDVFVCPRRRSRLTELVTPLKPLEAMAMACPVLASDVGGLAELVQPGVTGVLFEADSSADLVAQATRIGEDGALRARLGRAARAHTIERRSWDRIVAEYPEIYARAAAGRGV